jgi:Xaa-Pro dipeptidase
MILILKFSSGNNSIEFLWIFLYFLISNRQDSWFNYLFGAKESGFYGTICLSTGKSTLFVPKLPEVYKIWCGEIYPPEYFQHLYSVDEAFYVDDLKNWMHEHYSTSESGGKIHVMTGMNSDSGSMAKPARFAGDEEFWPSSNSTENHIQSDILYNLVSQCRVLKNKEEISVMRYVAWVGSMAHVEVMRSAKKCSFEYEFEAKFLYEIYSKGGCRRCAYTAICGCGPNSAVLHYGHAGAPNDRPLQQTDMVRRRK